MCDATAAARQRLVAQPPLRQSLASLAAVGPGSPLLALSTGAVGEAAGVAEGLVFEVLLGRVQAQLQVGWLGAQGIGGEMEWMLHACYGRDP